MAKSGTKSGRRTRPNLTWVQRYNIACDLMNGALLKEVASKHSVAISTVFKVKDEFIEYIPVWKRGTLQKLLQHDLFGRATTLPDD